MQHLYFDASLYSAQIEPWVTEPNEQDKFILTYLVPFLSLFGIWWNFLSLVIFLRNNYGASTYTYLCVIAGADFGNSVLIFTSALCKGILWESEAYRSYEVIIGLPLSSALGFLGTTALVSVAFDRVIYLRHAKYKAKSKLCKRSCARKAMLLTFAFSAILNMPYSFFFTWEDGELVPRDICFSEVFEIYNWVQFILGGVVPAILLIIVNVMLIYTMKQIKRKRQKYNEHRCNAKRATKINHQTFINVTLIGIIFLHLIGEFPTHLASMKMASTVLYGGDKEAAKHSRNLFIFREIMTVLNSVRLASNFVIYCLFCPDFRRNLIKMPLFRRIQKGKTRRKHLKMKRTERKDEKVIRVKRKIKERKVAVFVISERNKDGMKVNSGLSKISKY